jgi:hypothetical protein
VETVVKRKQNRIGHVVRVGKSAHICYCGENEGKRPIEFLIGRPIFGQYEEKSAGKREVEGLDVRDLT